MGYLEQNSFYRVFDVETYEERTPPDPARDTHRTPFEMDRDRLLYSFSFRRLQAKTQVFLAGDFDFYRTRLTHSLEVAQLGRSICAYLRRSEGSPLRDDFYVDPALVEASCLAHDLGHPPFGHAGERTLNSLMAEHGGFEGNAQTLRIVTKTLMSGGGKRRGMKPTRAFLDSILKYKTLYAISPSKDKHFIYNDGEPALTFIFEGQDFPASLKPGEERNNFRSVECQIMDWADDIAYSLNDLSDGIKAGFITTERLEKWAAHETLTEQEAEAVQETIRAIREDDVDRTLGGMVSDLIRGVSLHERSNHMSKRTNRYRYGLAIRTEATVLQKLFTRVAASLVFRSPQLMQLEYKGDQMLRQLFASLAKNYGLGVAVDHPSADTLRQTADDLSDSTKDFEYKVDLISKRLARLVSDAPTAPLLTLLPEEYHDELVDSDRTRDERLRGLCDYLAGMTDGFATRLYRRLFDPSFGSVADFI